MEGMDEVSTADSGEASQGSAPSLPEEAGWWRRWGVTPLMVDALIAVVTYSVAMIGMSVTDEPGALLSDSTAYALILAASMPLVGRRRWPVTTALASSVLTLVYFQLGYAGGPITIVLLVALYSAAVTGHRRWALLLIFFFVAGGIVVRGFVEGEPLVEVALNAALFVLVYLLGDVVYSRRALRAEVRERLRRLQAEREREAERRVVEERMRIARELHDIMAHTVATMTIHAGVAADLIDDDPGNARTALATIRNAARDAMAELRATVSVLRDGERGTPLPPAPGLGDLDGLVAGMASETLSITVHVSGDLPALPTAVDATAFRIVQEALTNVVRHAGATHVMVRVHAPQGGEVLVEVEDDGGGPAGELTSGYGLLGMRERAEALGGALSVEYGGRRGLLVRAHLPIEKGQP
jgi:signal transduction histidine kinase